MKITQIKVVGLLIPVQCCVETMHIVYFSIIIYNKSLLKQTLI